MNTTTIAPPSHRLAPQPFPLAAATTMIQLLLLLAAGLPGPAATIVWTNTSGGNWGAAANWSPNQLPGGADEAVITNNGIYTVSVTNVSPSVGRLILGGASGIQTLIVTNGPSLTVGNGSIVKTNGQMVVRTQALSLAGGLTNEGVINISGASLTIAGPGRLMNATNGLLVLGPSPVTFNGVLVENAGTVTWRGGNLTTGQLVLFRNLASGIWDMTGNGAIMGGAPPLFSPAAFENAGVVRKSAGTGTNSFGALFNSGTVDVRLGWLRAGLSQTAGATLLNGGKLIPLGTLNIQGGSLSGTGIISGSVTSSGQLSPGRSPGMLYIFTNYTQMATGALNIELGGIMVGTQHDRLNITGVATLDGALSVILINGFVPSLGDSFRIINCAFRIGVFARFDGLSLPGTGLRLDPVYSTTGLTLVTTKEPALSIQHQGNNVLISWSAAFGGWSLQSTTNLAAPDWTEFAPPGANLALLNPTEPHRYFRLIK